ncbi:hypothetical protein DXT99_11695 [Pontibacter diazotrophicus]|uniref:GTPase n=1 Tax=Pontibacter diazotrophicus TaxID=1400979 RepID=A0A3D8LC25_9BACT|nr:hypothetical protein [Pontibacter diazotrophicus]RDV14945.1 hypothetical protein DXT99_11695 [Pontibacter diazotrophicus]
MNQRLQFVYNAKTGLFNKLTDFAHKAISPATYNCNLCALTYGTFAMKQEWAEYIKSLPLEVVFIYRDEWKFRAAHRDYPLVVLQTGAQEPEVLLDAERLNELKSLKELKQAIQAALQDARSKHISAPPI